MNAMRRGHLDLISCKVRQGPKATHPRKGGCVEYDASLPKGGNEQKDVRNRLVIDSRGFKEGGPPLWTCPRALNLVREYDLANV